MTDQIPLILASGQPKQLPTGDTIGVAQGGTGADTAADARTNLGLATVAASGDFADLTNQPTIAEDILTFGFLSEDPGVSIALNDSTYQFTLTPDAATWVYYRAGKKNTITGAKSVTLSGSPPAADTYFIYIDSDDGTLIASTSVWSLDPDSTVVFVAEIEWNNALTPKYLLYSELHDVALNRKAHAYLHRTRGSQLRSGGVPSGYTLDDASADSSVRFSITQAQIYDETILHTAAAFTAGTDQYLCRYRDGAGGWAWQLSNLPFLLGSGTGIGYDDGDGTFADVSANYFVNVWMLVTAVGFQFIQPQAQHANLNSALAEDFSAVSTAGLAASEFVVRYRFTYEHKTSFGTTGEVKLQNVLSLNINPIPVSASIAPATHAPTHAAGSSDALELSDLGATGATDGYVLTADGSGGAAWEAPLAGVRNALINGCFRINQRAVSGTVALSAGVYGHDRWKAGASGCTYTFASSGGVTTLTITAGSLIQVIEGLNLRTGTYILTWTGTAQGKIGAGSYSASGVTGSVTGGSNLNIEFGTGTLASVQFEPGAVATPFEPRAVGAELALCQRYYQWGGRAQGVLIDSSTVQLMGSLGITMRVQPTISLSTTSPRVTYLNLSNYVGTDSTLTYSSIYDSRVWYVRIDGFSITNRTAGSHIYGSYSGSGSWGSDVLIFNAEL